LPLEYKSINFEIKEIDNKGHFVGVASPYNNVDLGDDRVKASIAPRNANKTVPYLWTHNVEEPIGTVKLISTNTGMNIDGQLFLDTSTDGVPVIPNAFKAYKSMKSGILSNSIGYQVMPNGAEYVTENGKTIRDLVDIDIKEVSGVLFPMNEQAVISDVKSQNLDGGDNLTTENKGASGSTTLPIADKTVKWDGPTATKNVFDKYTDDKGNISKEAQKAFFYVDTTKPNEKGSYKLPFADIADNKLTAIPNGVKAAANAIRGAQNPVNISDEDKKAVAKKINVYLKKLEFEEITDDQIKGDSSEEEGSSKNDKNKNDKNKKSDPTKLNVKALGFNAVYQTRQNREARWDAEMALDQSLDSIAQDEDMALEDKLTASNTTIDDFCNMYKQIMAGLISAMAQKSIDYQFETKSVYMERKSGKKISKATKEKIQGCKDSMSDLISILASLCEDDSDDPDNPNDNTGDDEGGKGCKPKNAGKSQNSTNQQKKENNDTLELKSEELQALEALCKTINEK
jgi:hypothetical protein